MGIKQRIMWSCPYTMKFTCMVEMKFLIDVTQNWFHSGLFTRNETYYPSTVLKMQEWIIGNLRQNQNSGPWLDGITVWKRQEMVKIYEYIVRYKFGDVIYFIRIIF